MCSRGESRRSTHGCERHDEAVKGTVPAFGTTRCRHAVAPTERVRLAGRTAAETLVRALSKKSHICLEPVTKP
jgi:hypothetical protein